MLARNSDLYFDVSASCSAFSSRPARLLRSRVLALDLAFCSREQPRFLLAPRWSAAARSAGFCSSLGQRLRLLEQVLGPHVGGDRVEDDADRLDELVEEDQVDLAEPLNDAELDDRLDLAFEQHRQDDDVERRRLAQPRADLRCSSAGTLVSRMRSLLERALADEPLAQPERAACALARSSA